MNSRSGIVTRTRNSAVQIKNSSTKPLSTQKKFDLKQSLKLLETGDVKDINMKAVSEELLLKPHLGDHMQYELHKYCQKGPENTDPSIVVKLAKLCYSNTSVLQFSNLDRFVGCLYFISSYLLKTGKYKTALEIVSSLEFRKTDIVNVSIVKADIRNFLYNLHSSFIGSAVLLASKTQDRLDTNYPICQQLATESLKVLQFIKGHHGDIGKKVLKTSKLFLQTLKDYNDEDVSAFYKSLKEVLKILLPSNICADYFRFYLHKMDQLKNLDATNGEVENMLRKTVNLLSLMCNFPSSYSSSLNSLVDCFFNNHDGISLNEDLFNNFLSDQSDCVNPFNNSELYFLLVSVIFCHGVQVWWNSVADWSTSISPEAVEKLMNGIMDMYDSHNGSDSLYCSIRNPYETCFSDLLNGNLQKMQYTVRLCFKNKVRNPVTLVTVARRAFKLTMKYLEFTTAKQCCKEQRAYAWKHSVIHHTNLVEDILRQPSTDMSWCFLKDTAADILQEIVKSEVQPPYELKRVLILFQRWHYSCMKLHNFSEALFVCVIYYLCYPKEEVEIASMWLETKKEAANEIFEETTVCDVLKTWQLSIKNFMKNHGYPLIPKPLLLMEMNAYSTCNPEFFQNPKTPYELATRIWKQLEKCGPAKWETALALNCLVATNVSGENERLPREIYDKCEGLFSELLKLSKTEKGKCRSFLHAANLRFSLFSYNVKLAESSEGKMDSSAQVLGYLKKAEEEKVKFGDDVDLNLTCNVIPTSNHLTVELETNYVNQLNDIVDLWKGALRNGKEESLTTVEIETWVRNVQQVARIYELLGEYQRAVRTWYISYKIGKLCNESGAILLGLSHLLKQCSDVDNSPLKREGEEISEKLTSENKEKHVLVRYSLTIAENYLKNKKLDKCVEYLNRAKKVIEGLRSTIRTFAVTAQMWCLVSRLISIHPESDVVFGYPSGIDIRITAFKAFSYVSAGGKSELINSATQSECTELVLAMIEVNTWAYHLHGVYRQTDFMRFFLDDLYRIVQKLFLPTRTAEMLVRLAEVDVICEKMSDCEGKVTKLRSILTTLLSGHSEIKSEKPAPHLSIPQGMDFEVPSPRPISPARFLDKPLRPKEADLSPMQYHMKEVKSFNLSEHSKECKCRLCQNLLIQILTMDTLRLEGEMYYTEKRSGMATACYSLAYSTMEKIVEVREEQSTTLHLELASSLGEGGMDFQISVVRFHTARFLIRHAFFESSNEKTAVDKVKKTMIHVSDIMKKFSYEEKLLNWTYMELKVYCVARSKSLYKPSPRASAYHSHCVPDVDKKTLVTPRPVAVTLPAQYKNGSVTKTPFVSTKSNPPSAAVKPKNVLPKSPHPSVQKKVISSEEESSGSDFINSTFIGVDRPKMDRNVGIKGRKLTFRTNEPTTITKTVKKASEGKPSSIKPRKLNLDETEGTPKTETRKGRKVAVKSKS